MKNINLCEILKGHEGETFYCSLIGKDVQLHKVTDKIVVIKNIDELISFHSNGGYIENGEMQLFPSKDQRDWNKWIEEQENKTPKTWSKLLKYSECEVTGTVSLDLNGDDYLQNNTPIEKSALALLKIHQLIEVGYGGNVTDEEWKSLNDIYTIQYEVFEHKLFIVNSKPMRMFSYLAFHTQEQAEEFLSYPENVKLLKDYFMI